MPTAPERSFLIVSETKLDILVCSASPAREYFWRLLTDHAVENLGGKDFPGGPVVKNPPANTGGREFDPCSGKHPPCFGQLRACVTATEPVRQSPWTATREAVSVRSLCPTARVATLVG